MLPYLSKHFLTLDFFSSCYDTHSFPIEMRTEVIQFKAAHIWQNPTVF